MGLGRMEAEILRLREELRLEDRVLLPGIISHNELPHILAEHDIFAAPCVVHESGRRDGIPNTVIEALAYGLPVVSTTVNALPEVVINGKTGLAVPPNDPEALADALQRLADDDALAQELARNGKQLAADMFDPTRNNRRLAGYFHQTLHDLEAKMCGIAGICQVDASPLTPEAGQWVKAMTDRMSHRGPDGEGQWSSGPVCLGHRRLSIIDLSGRRPANAQRRWSDDRHL